MQPILAGRPSSSSTLKWLRPGSSRTPAPRRRPSVRGSSGSGAGTRRSRVRRPQWPARALSVRGKSAGLARELTSGVSCRSTCRNGVAATAPGRTGRRSTARRRTSRGGRSARQAFQRQASSIAARCPPAEWPATTMRAAIAAVARRVAMHPRQRVRHLQRDGLDASLPGTARSSAPRPSRRPRRTAARRRKGRPCRARASSRRG